MGSECNIFPTPNHKYFVTEFRAEKSVEKKECQLR